MRKLFLFSALVSIVIATAFIWNAAAQNVVYYGFEYNACINTSTMVMRLAVNENPSPACDPTAETSNSWVQAVQGPAGLNWRGAWSSTASYQPSDTVNFGGAIYESIAASTNQEPDTSAASWQLLAQAGAQGPQGVIGLAGPQGPIGPTGPAGAQGPAGPAGATGAAGPAGPQGAQGANGAQGPQGPIGLTGPAGPQGPIGLAGAAGPQGPQGATGTQGLQGATGAQGQQGPAGLIWRNAWSSGASYLPTDAVSFGGSSYVCISANKNKEPDTSTSDWQLLAQVGAQGQQGTQGVIGPTGPQGPLGLTGPVGPQGPQGATGAQGPQGPIGQTGAVGPQGLQGVIGAQGPQGKTGPPGAMQVFDANGQFLGYLLSISSYTEYANLQPLGTGYKWDIYVPGLNKIVPIVQQSGQVASSFYDLLFYNNNCTGPMYSWNTSTVFQITDGGVSHYYCGNGSSKTLGYGTSVKSQYVDGICEQITTPWRTVPVYLTSEVPVADIPFSLPVALPMSVVGQ